MAACGAAAARRRSGSGNGCAAWGSPHSDPAHATLASTPQRRRRSKRGLAAHLATVRAVHPDATLALWSQDEHRLGLLPITRRV
jgi:hypothetical protein